MNIAAIRRNCAAMKTAILLDRGQEQWIFNGHSGFLVVGIRMTTEAIVSLFNLSPKQEDNWDIDERKAVDRRINAYPLPDEEDADACGALILREVTWLAIPSARGTLYIPYQAVAHINPDYRRYAIRWGDGDQPPLVAVYGDMYCHAVVAPATEQTAAELNAMAAAMARPAWTPTAEPTEEGGAA